MLTNIETILMEECIPLPEPIRSFSASLARKRASFTCLCWSGVRGSATNPTPTQTCREEHLRGCVQRLPTNMHSVWYSRKESFKKGGQPDGKPHHTRSHASVRGRGERPDARGTAPLASSTLGDHLSSSDSSS